VVVDKEAKKTTWHRWAGTEEEQGYKPLALGLRVIASCGFSRRLWGVSGGDDSGAGRRALGVGLERWGSEDCVRGVSLPSSIIAGEPWMPSGLAAPRLGIPS